MTRDYWHGATTAKTGSFLDDFGASNAVLGGLDLETAVNELAVSRRCEMEEVRCHSHQRITIPNLEQ